MAQRFVVLVNGDTAWNDEMVRELSRHHYRVEAYEEPSSLLQRTADLPDVIVLCVDPKPTGWAHSDRIRKSAQIGAVPLIIMSADASAEDFAAHRKLKRHADEYLHKPLDFVHLLDAIGRMTGSQDQTGAMVIETESESMEISLDDESMDGTMLLDESPAPGSAAEVVPSNFFEEHEIEEHTQLGAQAIANDVDAEAEAAFNAIAIDDSNSVTLDVSRMSASASDHAELLRRASGPAAAEANSPFERTSVVGEPPTTVNGSVPIARVAVAKVPAASRTNGIDLGIEQIRATPAAVVAPATAEASGGSFSREREFLNLREIINRKEKELLDAKDTIDQKDRQTLDVKDKLRDVERRCQTLETSNLDLQGEVVTLKERLQTFETEYAGLKDREQNGRTLLDQLQLEKQAVETELGTWEKRHATDVAKLTEAMQRKATEHDEHVRGLQARHATAIEQQVGQVKADWHSEREANARAFETQIKQVQAQLASEYKLTMDESEAQHAVELKEFTDTHQVEKKRLTEENTRTAQSLDAAFRQDLETAHAEHAAALAAQATQHDEALASARQAHQLKMQTIEQSHEDMKAGITQRHATQLEDMRRRFDDLQVQLADSRTEVQAHMDNVAHVKQAMQELQAQATQSDARVKERDERIGELEVETSMYQEQILKAYQRIKHDEETGNQVKRALAIALGVLDGGKVTEQEKSKS